MIGILHLYLSQKFMFMFSKIQKYDETPKLIIGFHFHIKLPDGNGSET